MNDKKDGSIFVDEKNKLFAKLMKEKTIDLENGFELVVDGNYKEHYNYEREILAKYGMSGQSRIRIRKKTTNVFMCVICGKIYPLNDIFKDDGHFICHKCDEE